MAPKYNKTVIVSALKERAKFEVEEFEARKAKAKPKTVKEKVLAHNKDVRALLKFLKDNEGLLGSDADDETNVRVPSREFLENLRGLARPAGDSHDLLRVRRDTWNETQIKNDEMNTQMRIAKINTVVAILESADEDEFTTTDMERFGIFKIVKF